MIYENPRYKKIKKSHPMMVSCGYCKTDIAEYQKVGKGGLLRMHIDRIVRSALPITDETRALICPECEKPLGARVLLKRENGEAFNMIRSAFNTRWI